MSLLVIQPTSDLPVVLHWWRRDSFIHSWVFGLSELDCGKQGILRGGISWDEGLDVLILNNTIANNHSSQGSAIFAVRGNGQKQLVNNIIIGSEGEIPVICNGYDATDQPIFKYNNVYGHSVTAYGGVCTDQTGLNGNISEAHYF